MCIEKNSVVNVSNSFRSVEDNLSACNYSVNIEALTFNLRLGHEFTMQDIEYLEYGTLYDGNINQIPFEICYKNINEWLAGDIYSYRPDNPRIIEDRIETFWNLVIKYTDLPPNHVYEYQVHEKHPYYYTLRVISYAFIHDNSGFFLFIFIHD